jgi:hypothetical protein
MKAPLALATLLAAALAGCAAAPETRLADAGCKVEPVTTAGVVNKKGPTTDLDRKWAAAQLRSSDYYRQSLPRDENAAVVQAARDCP